MTRSIVNVAIEPPQMRDGRGRILPFRLVRSKDLSLRMITDDLDVDEASNIELLGPEHRHPGDLVEEAIGEVKMIVALMSYFVPRKVIGTKLTALACLELASGDGTSP
jgi:hypothetical protein